MHCLLRLGKCQIYVSVLHFLIKCQVYLPYQDVLQHVMVFMLIIILFSFLQTHEDFEFKKLLMSILVLLSADSASFAVNASLCCYKLDIESNMPITILLSCYVCHQKLCWLLKQSQSSFVQLFMANAKIMQIVCRQYTNKINIDIICFVWHPFYILVTGPKENSQFCLPENPDVLTFLHVLVGQINSSLQTLFAPRRETVLQKQRLSEIVNFEEQIMSKDKFSSKFQS